MSVSTLNGTGAAAFRPAVAQAAARPVAASGADRPLPASAAPAASSGPSTAQQAAAELQEVLEAARQAIRQTSSSSLEFSVDEELGKTVVRLVDTTTQEVIRQIPSEDFLRMARSIESMRGLLLRQEA